jgi:hypothetical protein
VIDIPAVTVASTPPDIETANDGDLWYNSVNSILYIAYDDLQGTPSKQWVQVSFVALQEAIEDLVGAAPETLNTLEELAAALQDNPDIIDDILQAIGLRATQADLNTLSGVVATKANTVATIENITANYELVVADNSKVKQCINTDPITITVPSDSIALPVGARIEFLINGTDIVTFEAGTNATLLATELVAQPINGKFFLIKVAANTWQLNLLEKLDVSDKADKLANFLPVSANRTLELADSNNILDLTNSTAVTITVPANATIEFPIGTQIAAIRNGAGTVTFAPESGVTLRSVDNKRKIKGQFSSAALLKIDTNVWQLVGNLEA